MPYWADQRTADRHRPTAAARHDNLDLMGAPAIRGSTGRSKTAGIATLVRAALARDTASVDRLRARARAVAEDYQRVSAWSDLPSRARELAHVGSQAIALLRELGGEPR